MSDERHHWEREAHDARTAAEEGRWDAVQQYYDRRHAWLQGTEPTPAEAGRLAGVDREIERHVMVAQAALASVLADTAGARRILSHMKASLGAGPAPYRLIDRSV